MIKYIPEFRACTLLRYIFPEAANCDEIAKGGQKTVNAMRMPERTHCGIFGRIDITFCK